MKCGSRKGVYVAVELLFVLSFGYFIALSLLYLLKDVGMLLWGFSTGGLGAFGAFLHVIFFDEVSTVFFLLCFGFSIILSALIIISFRKQFRLRALIFTASAPLALLVVYGIVRAVYVLLEQYSSLHAYTREAFLAGIALALLIGYAIGFFRVLHRERQRIKCAE